MKDKFGRDLEVGDSVLYIRGGRYSFTRLDRIESLTEKTCVLESKQRGVMPGSLIEVNDISHELSRKYGYGVEI